jgi:prolyl oligopeptidase
VTTCHQRYPDAPRSDSGDLLHGLLVPDPYRWLEDLADPATVAWAAGQDELFTAERARWPDAQAWRSRLAELSAIGLPGVPVPCGARLFHSRQELGAELPTLMVTEHGAERPLISPLTIDPAGLTVLQSWQPSVDGALLAYQLSVAGTEDCELRVLDVDTATVVDGPIDRVRRSAIAWLPHGRHFYYVRRLAPELNPGEERYHRRVWLHEVGTDPARDVEVFGSGRDKTQFYSLASTPNGRMLAVTATAGTDPSTELYLADLHRGPIDRPCLRPIQQQIKARTTAILPPSACPGDPIWLRTTLDAPRGRIVLAASAGQDPADWQTLIAPRSDAVLEEFAPLGGPGLPRPLALVRWTRHAIGEITVHDLADGRQITTVPVPGEGTIGRLSTRPEGGHDAWFSYTDHARPTQILHYDASIDRTRIWPACGAAASGQAAREAGTALSSPPVRATLVSFSSLDGTEVRMFVVSASGRADRPRPAILTGYGGFGASMAPRYSPEAIAWVQAGGVYAVACLRGGGEEGEQWHRAGMLHGKPRVFEDFEAAADYLVTAGWADPERLALLGGSNGGLLVGAALTRRPSRYAAVACLAPLLDMARYELSGLGPSWRAEYGSTADPEEMRTLLTYSPYHHVVPGTKYPPVLFATFDNDTRVDPAHARKMCAALQHATTGPGRVLLRLERAVGHGARARSSQTGLFGDCLAFLACAVGLRLGPQPP